MKIQIIIISLIISLFFNLELKGCQCIGNGELDLQEYILSDLIAKVEVISFEQNDETHTSKTKVRIVENFKPYKNQKDTINFSSNYGGCSYSLTSGSYIVWANKNKNDTYSLSICSRFIKLYDKEKVKTYSVDPAKYKSKKKEMIRFLKRYRNKTGYVNLNQDGKIIQGNIEKGIPFGTWKVINNKNLIAYQFSFLNGVKNGIQISYRTNNPLAKSISNYQKGLLNGISQNTFVNGVPNMITTYKDGIENGLKYYYHMNGKLRIKGNMINGVEEGEWQYYRQNGKLEKVIKYELIKGKIPQRELMIKNYSKREYLIYDENETLAKKTISEFTEKVFEQEFRKKEDDVQSSRER